MNPLAFAFWLLLACIGYLIGESIYSAITGLSVGLSLSVLASFIR